MIAKSGVYILQVSCHMLIQMKHFRTILLFLLSSVVLSAQSIPVQFLPVDFNTSPSFFPKVTDYWTVGDKLYFQGDGNDLYVIQEKEIKLIYKSEHDNRIQYVSKQSNGFYMIFNKYQEYSNRLVFWDAIEDELTIIHPEQTKQYDYLSNNEGLFYIGINYGDDGRNLADKAYTLYYTKGHESTTVEIDSYKNLEFYRNGDEDFSRDGDVYDRFYLAGESLNERSLHITDGTLEGTEVLTDKIPNVHLSSKVYDDGNHMYFATRDYRRRISEIMVSDGTPEGTYEIVDSTITEDIYEINNVILTENGLVFKTRLRENQIFAVEGKNDITLLYEDDLTLDVEEFTGKFIFHSRSVLGISNGTPETTEVLIDFSNDPEYGGDFWISKSKELANGDIILLVKYKDEKQTLIKIDSDNALTTLGDTEFLFPLSFSMVMESCIWCQISTSILIRMVNSQRLILINLILQMIQ